MQQRHVTRTRNARPTWNCLPGWVRATMRILNWSMPIPRYQVAEPVLPLRDHEESGEHVLNDALGSETERHSHHRGRRDEWAVTRLLSQVAKRVSSAAPVTNSTISSPLPRTQAETSVNGVNATGQM